MSALATGARPAASARPTATARSATSPRLAATALFCVGVSLAQAQASQSATATIPDPTRSAGSSTPSTPSSPLAVVVQPRPSGYFVGDLVTQRVLLEGIGQPVALPPPDRVNTWLERRHTTIDTDASGRRWLVIEYQFLNAPKAVTAVTLPGWQLTVKASAATPPVTLKVPATSLNVAPLSPPGSPQQVGTRDLRPDRVPANIATTPIFHAIAISTGGLALTLVAWLAWVLWRNKRAAATQPFAHALRELRTLTDDQPHAWQVLHRAFDRAAGRVIHTATLPTLFERSPQLIPVRPEIEEFFAQSNQLFFANANANTSSGAAPPNDASPRSGLGSHRPVLSTGAAALSGTPPSAAILTPLTLCLELRRIEKRHEQ
jgi:mxaA protein